MPVSTLSLPGFGLFVCIVVVIVVVVTVALNRSVQEKRMPGIGPRSVCVIRV